MFLDTIKFLQKKKTEKKNRKKKFISFCFHFPGSWQQWKIKIWSLSGNWDFLPLNGTVTRLFANQLFVQKSHIWYTQIARFAVGASHRGNWPFSRDVKSNIFHLSCSCVFLKELMEHFHPVFRHFFLERFPDPAVWFERRLCYTRGVATSSIGTVIRFVVQFQKTF